MRILYIFSVLFLLSCGGSSENSASNPAITGDAVNGNTIYNSGLDSAAACIDCHGTNGAGMGATTSTPNSGAVTSIDLKTRSSVQIESAINNGRSSGSIIMPSYSYSAQDIADVTSYIRTL